MRQALADLESAGDADRLLEAHWAYAELLEAQGRINEALQQWKLATGLARPDLQSRAAPRPVPAAPPERA